jgi:serine protease Do
LLFIALVFAPIVVAADDPIDLQLANQQVFRQAVDKVSPYIVQIETVGGVQPRNRLVVQAPNEPTEDGTPVPEPEINPFQDTTGSSFLIADGPTTGIVYAGDGYILSSSFNFVREPAYVTVRLPDGRQFVADVVARDKVRKLALLKIEAEGLGTPEWVPPSEIRVGQWSIALGRGFGGEAPSVTVGIVSAVNRMMGNAIQTDAKLSPANYGGPLIDIHGRIMGICVPMAQRPGELAGVEFYDAGIGFALPRDRVEKIVGVLRTGKSFERGWLGIQLQGRADDGLPIRAVADPSPTRHVGIKAGDVIVQANGKSIRNFSNLVQAIYMVPAGEIVQLVVRRDELEYGFEVTLAAASALGPLVEEVEPLDPSSPFPKPGDSPWP